ISRLNAGLRSMAGLAVSMVGATDLPTQDLLRLIAASDVVHFVGRVDGRRATGESVLWWWGAEPLDVSAIASLGSTPPLLISQDDSAVEGRAPGANRAVALGASKCGLNVLT